MGHGVALALVIFALRAASSLVSARCPYAASGGIGALGAAPARFSGRRLQQDPNSPVVMAPPVCELLNEGELPSNDPGRLCDVFQAIYLTLSEMWAGATNGEKAGIMGQSVRISFHDPAEFDRASNDNRGPDGCLCTSPGCGSEGLIEADSLIFTDQEPLWQLWCDVVGRADFWNMYARAAMEISEAESAYRLGYTRVLPELLETRYGRKDATGFDCDVSRRLPDAMCADSKLNFVDALGLTAADGVALIGGGHTVGNTNPSVSGFGPVVPTESDPNPPQSTGQWVEGNWLFNNEFFSGSLLQGNWHMDGVSDNPEPGATQQWVEIITIDGSPETRGVAVPNCESGQGPCGSLKGFNLLNADLALAFDVYNQQTNGGDGTTTPVFIWQNRTDNPTNIFPQPTCEATTGPENSSPGAQDTPVICGGKENTCSRNMQFKEQIDSYANATDASNMRFLNDFASAWNRVVVVGYGGGLGLDGKLDTRLGAVLPILDVSQCRAPLPDFEAIIGTPGGGAPAPAPAPAPEPAAATQP